MIVDIVQAAKREVAEALFDQHGDFVLPRDRVEWLMELAFRRGVCWAVENHVTGVVEP